MVFLTSKELLLTLFLKMDLAASLAALLARSATFRKVLYTEQRDAEEKIRLMLFFTPPLAAAESSPARAARQRGGSPAEGSRRIGRTFSFETA
jgi:hypothetical protein